MVDLVHPVRVLVEGRHQVILLRVVLHPPQLYQTIPAGGVEIAHAQVLRVVLLVNHQGVDALAVGDFILGSQDY